MNKNNNFKYFYYVNFTIDPDEYREFYKDIYGELCNDDDTVVQFAQECVAAEMNSLEDDLKKFTYYNEPSVVSGNNFNDTMLATICDNLKSGIYSHIPGAKACVIKHVNDHFKVTTVNANGEMYAYDVRPFVDGHAYKLKTNKRKKKHGNPKNL